VTSRAIGQLIDIGTAKALLNIFSMKFAILNGRRSLDVVFGNIEQKSSVSQFSPQSKRVRSIRRGMAIRVVRRLTARFALLHTPAGPA
jgi:hypothetical protein